MWWEPARNRHATGTPPCAIRSDHPDGRGGQDGRASAHRVQQRLQLGLDEHLLAVEKVDIRVRHLTVHQQQQARLETAVHTKHGEWQQSGPRCADNASHCGRHVKPCAECRRQQLWCMIGWECTPEVACACGMRSQPPAPLAVVEGPPEGHAPHAQDERAAGRDGCGAADVAP